MNMYELKSWVEKNCLSDKKGYEWSLPGKRTSVNFYFDKKMILTYNMQLTMPPLEMWEIELFNKVCNYYTKWMKIDFDDFIYNADFGMIMFKLPEGNFYVIDMFRAIDFSGMIE